MKTVVFISDLHCGSVFGITPPDYFSAHHKELQSESWSSYQTLVNKWKEPDILVVNGDAIEGRQSKQGGAELITPDRNVQVDMAVYSIKEWKAKKIFMTYGSQYHVGEQAEDFEYSVAAHLGATIEGRLFLDIEGVNFDIRHKTGTSSSPYGRATNILRDLAWDLIKEASGTGPRIDVVVRSHAHYHILIEQSGKVAFITPALQISRGRYGSRECIGDTHWGAMRMTIHEGEVLSRDKAIVTLTANQQQVIKA